MKSDPRTRLGLCNQESQEAFFEERRKKVKADREQGALKERPSPVRPLLLVPRVSCNTDRASVFTREVLTASGKPMNLLMVLPSPDSLDACHQMNQWTRWLKKRIRETEGWEAKPWTLWRFPSRTVPGTFVIDVPWNFKKDALLELRSTVCDHYDGDQLTLYNKLLSSEFYVPVRTTANSPAGMLPPRKRGPLGKRPAKPRSAT